MKQNKWYFLCFKITLIAGVTISLINLTKIPAWSFFEKKIPRTVICENQECRTIDQLPQEIVLNKLNKFFSKHKKNSRFTYIQEGQKIYKGTIPLVVLRGSQHAYTLNIQFRRLTEIFFIDREKSEINTNLSINDGYKELFPVAGGLFTIKGDSLSFTADYGRPVRELKVDWLIDYIDFDHGIISGSVDIAISGTVNGSISTYVYTSLNSDKESFLRLVDNQKKTALLKQPGTIASAKMIIKDEKKQADTPPKKETELISEEPAQLAFTTKLQLPGGGRILQGGKEAVIVVNIENKGKGPASNVAVILSGTKKLIAVFGESQFIDKINAGEKRTVEFKALLPGNIPAETAELKISLQEGQNISAAGTKTIKVAMKPSAIAKEETQVIEAPPILVFSTKINDQNKNRIFDGGEEVSLTVTVQNTGGTMAEGVEVYLSGNPKLIKALGQKKFLGSIKPQEQRSIEFTARLPVDISTQTAELNVSLREAKGFSPAIRKTLKLAMRTGEQDTEDIVSEISVDDIPPKIKKYTRPGDYAVLIGITSYRDKNIAQVKYADRDVMTVAKYFENLAGIPKPNIKILTNEQATKSDIAEALEEWLPRRVKPESNIFVFFAGHGTPDIKGEEAFIVPYEGHPDSQGKLVPLKKFYQSLDKLGAKNVLVMLDSCFSGAKGRSIVPEGGRAVVIKLKDQVMSSGGVTVMAAAAGTQISSDYDKEKHGLFTYYLLKGMRGEAKANENGLVELGELFTFVKKNVSEKASLELSREQTPVLLPVEDYQNKMWKIPIVMTR